MRITGTDDMQAQPRTKSAMPRTPGLVLGPFYPVLLAREQGMSTSCGVAGSSMQGRRLEISGFVFDTLGHPVAGASIELWQADSQGRYRHPSQPGVEEIDVCFVGFQMLTSQADGRWHAATVVPGPYMHEGIGRAPH